MFLPWSVVIEHFPLPEDFECWVSGYVKPGGEVILRSGIHFSQWYRRGSSAEFLSSFLILRSESFTVPTPVYSKKQKKKKKRC